MDRDDILDRLDMLVQLCKDTEPDVDKMNNNKINSILQHFSSEEDTSGYARLRWL